MKIGGTNGINGPGRIYPNGRTQGEPTTEPGPLSQGDRVEISDAARLSEAMARIPDIRAEKVAGAKALMAAGRMDTPERMDVALELLLDEMLPQAELI
jgi:hypothetical protein